MITVKKILNNLSYKKVLNKINLGSRVLNDPIFIKVEKLTQSEINKSPLRFEIINFLVKQYDKPKYLEIGVRNPEDNFKKIAAFEKYSVDPGVEFELNPVDFKVTSDEFFNGLRNGKFLNKDFKFDLIFIDGLHLAEQVEKDINNALNLINDTGYIILHDCNPPSEFHARESFNFENSPAFRAWNGTTWKAFFKVRHRLDIFSCCIDTDWGVGVISKTKNLGKPTVIENPFFEFKKFDENRRESLNLISFEEFQKKVLS